MPNVIGKIDTAPHQNARTVNNGQYDTVMGAGVFNLTEAQTPVLVQWSMEKAKTWLTVRMELPKQ